MNDQNENEKKNVARMVSLPDSEDARTAPTVAPDTDAPDWYPCFVCGAEHNIPACPFEKDTDAAHLGALREIALGYPEQHGLTAAEYARRYLDLVQSLRTGDTEKC